MYVPICFKGKSCSNDNLTVSHFAVSHDVMGTIQDTRYKHSIYVRSGFKPYLFLTKTLCI